MLRPIQPTPSFFPKTTLYKTQNKSFHHLFAKNLTPNSSNRFIHQIKNLPNHCASTFRYHNGPIHGLALLPNGKLASGSSDGTAKIKDLNSNAAPTTLYRPSTVTGLYSLDILMKNWLIAAGSQDGIIYLWDPETGKDKGRYGGTENGLNTYVFALSAFLDKILNKYYIVSGSLDGKILGWDPSLSPSRASYLIGSHSKQINALTMFSYYDSPSNANLEVLASASDDQTIKIWYPAIHQTKLLRELSLDAKVCALTVLSNRQLLVSGSDDGTIRLLNPSQPNPLIKIIDTKTDGTPLSDIQALTTFSNGVIASGHINGEINLWQPENEFPYLYTLPEKHAMSVTCLKVFTDETLVSGSDDKTIKWWKFQQPEEIS